MLYHQREWTSYDWLTDCSNSSNDNDDDDEDDDDNRDDGSKKEEEDDDLSVFGFWKKLQKRKSITNRTFRIWGVVKIDSKIHVVQS